MSAGGHRVGDCRPDDHQGDLQAVAEADDVRIEDGFPVEFIDAVFEIFQIGLGPLQALGRPAEAYVAYYRAAKLYTQSRERPYACSAMVNCVDALLDEGKLVAASAVMGQVDGMLKGLDPPPEWLLRDVDVQAARLAALSRQAEDQRS